MPTFTVCRRLRTWHFWHLRKLQLMEAPTYRANFLSENKACFGKDLWNRIFRKYSGGSFLEESILEHMHF